MSCCLMFVNQCQSPLWPNLTIDLEANFPKSANQYIDNSRQSFEDLKVVITIFIVLHSETVSYFYCSNNFYSLRESVGPIDMPNILFWRVETTRGVGQIGVEQFLWKRMNIEQGHELLEIMTYDWRTGVLQLLPKMRLIRQQQSFLGTLQSSQKW